jgi:hypothetical protein
VRQGSPPIITATLPIAIPFGAGDTQAIPPGMVFATAAGIPPINTVGTAAAGVIGPPTCGLGPSMSGQRAMSPSAQCRCRRHQLSYQLRRL